jgi:hypothetical protein
MDEPDGDEDPAARDLYAALNGASPSSPNPPTEPAIAADINGLH